jgi:hypothetical protein
VHVNRKDKQRYTACKIFQLVQDEALVDGWAAVREQVTPHPALSPLGRGFFTSSITGMRRTDAASVLRMLKGGCQKIWEQQIQAGI